MFIDPVANYVGERVWKFLPNEMARAEHGQPTFGQTLSQKLGDGQRTTRSRNPARTIDRPLRYRSLAPATERKPTRVAGAA